MDKKTYIYVFFHKLYELSIMRIIFIKVEG